MKELFESSSSILIAWDWSVLSIVKHVKDEVFLKEPCMRNLYFETVHCYVHVSILIHLLLCFCFWQWQRTLISYWFYGTKWPLDAFKQQFIHWLDIWGIDPMPCQHLFSYTVFLPTGLDINNNNKTFCKVYFELHWCNILQEKLNTIHIN